MRLRHKLLSILLSAAMVSTTLGGLAPSVQAYAQEQPAAEAEVIEETAEEVTDEGEPEETGEEQTPASSSQNTEEEDAAVQAEDEDPAQEETAADETEAASDETEEDTAQDDESADAAVTEEDAAQDDESADAAVTEEDAAQDDESIDNASAAEEAEEALTDGDETAEEEQTDETVETETEAADPMLSGESAGTVPAQSISITTKADEVGIGASVKFAAEVAPANATNKTVVWSSADDSVAKVDQNGTVTGVSTGYVVIYAEHTENGNTFTDSYGIVVTQGKISNVSVTGIKNAVFTGKEITQKPVLTSLGRTLKEGEDYEISYENNVHAGTAKVIIEGYGDFEGTTTKTFKIAKAQNTISIVAKTLNVPQTLIKAQKKGLNTYLFADANEAPKISYKLLSVPKKAGKKIKLNSKGRLTLMKGIKSGTYNIKVRVTAAATKDYKKATKTVTYKIVVKKQLAKYKTLDKLGAKGYSKAVNKKVDKAFEDMILYFNERGMNFKKFNKFEKAYAITLYIGFHYYYQSGEHDAEGMLDKGYGTCWAYSDLTYLMARKAGLRQSWLTVSGRNVPHNNKFYGSEHRSVVTKIGKKYYELDSNGVFVMARAAMQSGMQIDLRPEQITKSYARYLLGKSKKYTRINPK